MRDTSALDLLPDAVVIVDAAGVLVGCNTMAGRLLGIAPAAAIGRAAGEAVPLSDEAGADWWTCARPLDGDPRLLPRIPEQALRVRLPDGRHRGVTLTAARVAGEDGTLEQLVVVLRRAERRERLDAARSDLVSTVSHELRSPLTSVKGFTKTLLAKWDRFTDEQKRQMLATVNEDADRVTRLLGELLDVSRIDAGRLQLRRQMVDVGDIVAKVVDRMRVTGGGERVDARLPEDELPKLYADADKVEQVFTNLIENALKYGAGAVRVTAEVGPDDVRFTVTDEGEGIPSAYLSHVFTKFFRRAGERRSGTGLGLYISRGIVQAHGGEIWAESGPGAGARFHFTLPRGGLELAGIAVPERRPS